MGVASLIGFLESSRTIAHERLDKRLSRKTSFEVARLLGLLIIVGVTFDLVFSLPEWQQSERAFRNWATEYSGQNDVLEKRLDSLSVPTNDLRSTILSEINRAQIDLQGVETANDLYRKTRDEIGISPRELESTLNYLTTLMRTRGPTLLSELDDIEVSQGGFINQRIISLREQIIIQVDQHPALAIRFQAALGEFSTLTELSEALIAEAANSKARHGELIAAWDGFIKKSPGWAAWSLDDFSNLSDDFSQTWERIFEPLNSVSRQILIDRIDSSKPLSEATVVLRAFYGEERTKDRNEESSASIFSVSVSLPRTQILLFSPFLWFLSVGIVRFMVVGVAIARLSIWRIERQLSDLVGETSAVGQFIGPEIANPQVGLINRRTLHPSAMYAANPNFFIDASLSLFSWTVALYVLERWVRLVFGDVLGEWSGFGWVAVSVLAIFVIAIEVVTRTSSRTVWQKHLNEIKKAEGRS